MRAYWRLAQAVAEYHYCFDHVQTLAQLKARGSDEASLRSGRAAAAAQLREAELDAVRAQHELAGLLRLPAGAALPLPADRPHVGAYRTIFNEQFAARTPPEPARLAEKILPFQRQVIDDRAAAVQAAEDALAAVADDYQSGRADAAAVAACSGQLLGQRRAFIRSVCGYNRNIADYGLTVVPPATTPQTWRDAHRSGAAGGRSRRRGRRASVQPAGATEPIPGSRELQPARNEPTLAPPRSRRADAGPAARRLEGSEPTPAPPRRTDARQAGRRPRDAAGAGRARALLAAALAILAAAAADNEQAIAVPCPSGEDKGEAHICRLTSSPRPCTPRW